MSGNAGGGTANRARYVARALSLVWACFWLIFGLLSGAGAGTKGLVANAPNALPGLLFVASALLAWRWQRLGGVVLLAEGLVLAVGYPLIMHGGLPASTIVFTLVIISLPPLVAGILFLLARTRARTGEASGTGSVA
jgi:hypothetical protein